MAEAASNGMTVTCSFGLGASTLTVPFSKIKVRGGFAATIFDSNPGLNISPVGACISMANPVVAAMVAVPPIGVLKPQPCTPMIPGTPWVGCASKVRWSGKPPLTTDGCLNCIYGGQIKIVPGVPKVKI